MSRKVFTAGEVLAAADVNSFLMDQTVMSFAGTAARGSAIPTPVDGMTTYREDTDRLESWTGSQWVSPSDLVLIKSQTIGSAVTSVAVTNVFSSSFDAYKVIVSGGVASTSGQMTMRLGSTATGYRFVFIYATYLSATVIGDVTSNAAQIPVGIHNTNRLHVNTEINSPFISGSNTMFNMSYIAQNDTGHESGFLNDSNSYTDFTLFCSSGTMTGGNIQVYGYRKAL